MRPIRRNRIAAQTIQVSHKTPAELNGCNSSSRQVHEANAGSQTTPPIDSGWVGLYVVTVSYGKTAIGAASIAQLITAPLYPSSFQHCAPALRRRCRRIQAAAPSLYRPASHRLKWRSGVAGREPIPRTAAFPVGAAPAAAMRASVTPLVAGQTIPVTVGSGGAAGNTSGAIPSAGGTSSFGTYVSATGGSLNPLASVGSPQNGATPGGNGFAGDVNIMGSAGQAGVWANGARRRRAHGGHPEQRDVGRPGHLPRWRRIRRSTGANSATS